MVTISSSLSRKLRTQETRHSGNIALPDPPDSMDDRLQFAVFQTLMADVYCGTDGEIVAPHVSVVAKKTYLSRQFPVNDSTL